MIAYNVPLISVVVGFGMILLNMIIVAITVEEWGLKMGFLKTGNYNTVEALLGRPWLHLQNIAIGVILAQVYWRILKYRCRPEGPLRDEDHPIVSRIIKYKFYAWALFGCGAFWIAVNMLICYPAHANPSAVPMWVDQLYFCLSRPTFMLGWSCIIVCLFSGHFEYMKFGLSSSNMRIFAQSVPIGCLVLLFCIHGVWCSDIVG